MKRALLPVLAIVLLAACGSATGDLGSVAPPAATSQASLEPPSPEPTPGGSFSPSPSSGPTDEPAKTPKPGGNPTPTPASEFTTVRAYFFLGSFVDNAGLVPVLREVPRTRAVGAAAMNALLAGPNGAELGARPAMYTSVPEGTRFLGLRIESGIATVNLSREFESGGGSAAVLGRLAQVVYTLTQFPNVRGVVYEGTRVPGPGLTRKDMEEWTPAILVESPVVGETVSGPIHVTGTANTFEANVILRLEARGRKLGERFVTATSGSGTRGTFDGTIAPPAGTTGPVTLVAFEPSAVDGRPTHVVRIPLRLQ